MKSRSRNGSRDNREGRNNRNKRIRPERAHKHESQETHANRKASRKFKACTSKKTFATQTEAARAAFEHNRTHPIVFTPMGEYGCRCCRRWHIGHDRRELRLEKQRLLEIYAADIRRMLRYSPPLYTRSIGF